MEVMRIWFFIMRVKKLLNFLKYEKQDIQRIFRGDFIYSYNPSDRLSVLKFDFMTEEWLDFIARCIKGETHSYDIVEGPMANDTVWNYVNDFLTGRISRKQFWVLAEFKHPTHQISFHTLSALNCLAFERSELLDDRKGKE